VSTITISAFLGASLAVDDLLLPQGVGVVSTNQRPGFGDLRPWESPGAAVATLPSSPQRLTMHRMGQDVASDANYWLGWTEVVHAVRGFEADDATERTYFTGSGTPKWTDNILALGGGPPYPQASRELAVPAPTAALVATVNTASTAGTEQAFMWAWTFVNDLGWESAPSPASNSILAKPGTTFNLEGFTAAPGGAYGINRIRLYRFVPGTTTAGGYFFHREWVIGSTPANPIDDARAVGSDPIATTGYRPPPSDGKCMTKLWGGTLAMISGKTVRFCVPYLHYAWPLAYEIGLPSAGVALAVWGQRLLALTTGDAYVITGTTPDSMDDEPTNINRPCSSARSVVAFNEGEAYKGVVWASEGGLCWYGDGGFRLLTEGLLTQEQWQAMNPASMVASRVLGFYVCFYLDGSTLKGFVLDPKAPQGMYHLSTGYHAAFRDPVSDRLFVLDGANVRRWGAGAAMTATFRSKLIQTPAPEVMRAVEVIAKGYPVNVKVWADGTLVLDQAVTSDDVVRPSITKRADQFQVEVSSAARVVAVRLASSVDELRSA
jgi:hypothetical protein